MHKVFRLSEIENMTLEQVRKAFKEEREIADIGLHSEQHMKNFNVDFWSSVSFLF